MEAANLKKLLDACFQARHIVETLPALPKGMKPNHIHVLGIIHEVLAEQDSCRVSDVSTRMNVTMPSITKLIQELNGFGLLVKLTDPGDKRVTLLRLTDAGEECVKRQIHDFHDYWASLIDGISDAQVEDTVCVIDRLWNTMPKEMGGSYGKEGK